MECFSNPVNPAGPELIYLFPEAHGLRFFFISLPYSTLTFSLLISLSTMLPLSPMISLSTLLSLSPLILPLHPALPFSLDLPSPPCPPYSSHLLSTIMTIVM